MDLLRGLAAWAVVVIHIEEVKLSGPVLPHAYLAVDFFFALSGFVIANAYEHRLRDGLSPWAFLLQRVIRLYPMAFLAVMLGTAVLLAKLYVDPSRVDTPARIVASTAVNLFILPSPFGGVVSQDSLFPCNGPLWSIFFEMFVYIVWCIALARARTATLVVIVLGCFVLLSLIVMRQGTADLGFAWATFPGGLARVGFGFGLGLLIYRLKPHVFKARRKSFRLLSALLLFGIFMVPRNAGFAGCWDLFCISIAVPLVLLLGLNSADDPRFDHILGEASYPLYTIHFPFLLLASGVHQIRPGADLGLVLGGTALALVVATWAAMKFYDQPLRRALLASWTRRGHRPSESGPTFSHAMRSTVSLQRG